MIGSPPGGIFSGAGITGNIFDPSIAGFGDQLVIYNYTLSSECNGADSSLVFIKNCPNSIEILNDNSSFTISPNPARDNFSIQISASFNNARVEIYNVLGEKIYSSQLNSKQIHLNVSAGIYFVKVIDGEKIICKKLVVE